MKTCPECGEQLPVKQFAKLQGRRYRSRICRACAQQRKDDGYRSAAAIEGRKRSRVGAYGLTVEQHDEMLAKQNGVCAICKEPERAVGTGGRPRALAVDHNHQTGAVRGLLCNGCNTGIGMMRDCPIIMLAGAEYVEADAPACSNAAGAVPL